MNSVSLYIPCFNAGKTLAACLDAVLGQSEPAGEVVVVDDGSGDETARIAARYPVKYLRHAANLGLAAARNSALRETRGEFVASVDADCVCEKDWLEILLGHFSSSHVAGAGGKLLETRNTRPADLWRAMHMKQHWGDAALEPPFLFGANTVFRRSALEKSGFYDEAFRNNYEDVDICARLKKAGYALAYEPRAVAYHLREDSTLTLLNTYWQWYVAFYRQEKFYDTPERFWFKLEENLGTANRYLEEDLESGRKSLVFLDLLFAFHHSLRDLKHYLAQQQKGAGEEASGLTLWLVFVDIVFFSRFDADAACQRTLLRPSSAFEQNCFALAFVCGRFLEEKFPSEDFRKILFRSTLLVLFNIDDPVLCDRFLELIHDRPDWRSLLEKGHPYLDRVFLEKFFQIFVKYVERLMVRFPGVVAAAETSAQSTQQTWEAL